MVQAGGNLLATGISKNTHISKLILAHNKLGESVAQIGRNLPCCKVLGHLDLSACNIMDEDFIQFLREVRVLHTLKVLILRENFIREKGGLEMLEVLRVNRSLVTVDLSRNFISIKTLDEIEAYV